MYAHLGRVDMGHLIVVCVTYAPVSVIPGVTGNPGDSDSFLTSHPGGYDNGVQTQGQI